MKKTTLLPLIIGVLCGTMIFCAGCDNKENEKDPNQNNNLPPQQQEDPLPEYNGATWTDMTGWEGSYTLEQAKGYAKELPIYPEERGKWMTYYLDKMNYTLLPVFTEGQKIDEQLLLNSGIIFAPWIELTEEERTEDVYYSFYFEKKALEDGILRHMGQKVEKPQTTDLLIYDEAADRYYLEVFGADSYYLRMEKLLQTNEGDYIGCFNAYSMMSVPEDKGFADETDVFNYFNSDMPEDLPPVTMKVVLKWRPLDDGSGTDVLYLAHETLEAAEE